MFEFIKNMLPENEKINEVIELGCKGFFINSNLVEKEIDQPTNVKKSLVKKRLETAKERIENGEPFLLLSFSKIQKKSHRNF